MIVGSAILLVASKGRPESLERALPFWLEQGMPIALVVTSPEDLPLHLPKSVETLFSKPGLTTQRNTGLRWVGERYDIVIFFDDDFLPCKGWRVAAEKSFQEHPELAALTGNVLADGMVNRTLTWDEAEDITHKAKESISLLPRGYNEIENPYGCNMAFRTKALKNICFDERLPLYGWLEDLLIGGELRKQGWKIGKIMNAQGVHVGSKTARQNGLRMGYSQVMNNFYIWCKGAGRGSKLLSMVLRNIAANILGILKGDLDIDRKGRLDGNILAISDIIRGRITPERIVKL